ncbi:hypothetical protein Tco_0446360 [Tanacetum coccineum]
MMIKLMVGHKEEANYAYRGYKVGGYRGNYYGRNSKNWHDHQPRDDNRYSQPCEDDRPTPLTPRKKLEETNFEKTMHKFLVAQRSSNEFVRNQFFNLKTKVEQGLKNYQSVIQDLETKFGRISDQCSTRLTGSLLSNTETNPKPSPSNDKPYRPPPVQNKHLNVIFTHSGKTYDLPVNPNDKNTIIHGDNKDEAGEAEKKEEPSSSTPNKPNQPPLNATHQKFTPTMSTQMMEEELDALLNDYDPFLSTSEKINETSLDKEFEEFLAIDVEEIHEQEEEVNENYSPTPYQYPLCLNEDEKKRHVSVLKNHKDAFSWKIYDISSISPSFHKHKLNFEDDAKPVIQRQRRLNPNMKEVMKKEIIKLLDADIIYPIEDSSWFTQNGRHHFNPYCDTKRFSLWDLWHGQYEGNHFRPIQFAKFDIEIKIKKAAKNVTAYHLSRLENPNLEKFMEEDIDDNFPDETLMYISTEEEIPWFPNFANYLV